MGNDYGNAAPKYRTYHRINIYCILLYIITVYNDYDAYCGCWHSTIDGAVANFNYYPITLLLKDNKTSSIVYSENDPSPNKLETTSI